MTRQIDTLLRSLDPARPDASPHSPRARADLARIVSTDPDAGVAGRRRGRRTARTLLGSGAVLVAATTAVVALPGWTGGDRAFASWTAEPAHLSAQQTAQAAEQCRRAQSGGAGSGYERQLSSATPAVAEQRGDWTTVLLAGPDGFAATCITDESTHLFRDWFGSIGVPTGYAPPGRRDVVATDLGVGAIGAGDLSVIAGAVGADVTALSYASRSEGTVEATVSHGRFALWVPGDDLEDASRTGVALSVTYRDGSTAVLRVSL